jgi:hypothetical protein
MSYQLSLGKQPIDNSANEARMSMNDWRPIILSGFSSSIGNRWERSPVNEARTVQGATVVPRGKRSCSAETLCDESTAGPRCIHARSRMDFPFELVRTN